MVARCRFVSQKSCRFSLPRARGGPSGHDAASSKKISLPIEERYRLSERPPLVDDCSKKVRSTQSVWGAKHCRCCRILRRCWTNVISRPNMRWLFTCAAPHWRKSTSLVAIRVGCRSGVLASLLRPWRGLHHRKTDKSPGADSCHGFGTINRQRMGFLL